MIPYTLTRSKRKTLSLIIRDGTLLVRAPLKMPKRDIDQFVSSKEKWIHEKLAQTNEHQLLRDQFHLDYGSHLLYRGKTYPIEGQTGYQAGFDGKRFFMPIGLTSEHIKEACIKVYRLLAKSYIADKLKVYENAMGVTPKAVKITSARTRWGSCSSKKNINFSWRLIMAEDEVIDYVIVHELAHLIEMNHSKMFWAIVENVLPDFQQRQLKLRDLQLRLVTENWGVDARS